MNNQFTTEQLAQKLHEARETIERQTDALDHIQRVCAGSRTQTRRIRWIAVRCKSAIDADEKWRDADVPKMDPLVESLRDAVKMIYPVAKAELAALLEAYAPAEIASESDKEVIDAIAKEEPLVADDCTRLVEFLDLGKQLVPAIHFAERKAVANG